MMKAPDRILDIKVFYKKEDSMIFVNCRMNFVNCRISFFLQGGIHDFLKKQQFPYGINIFQKAQTISKHKPKKVITPA